MIFNNPSAPATHKQLWALRCITGIDYRNAGLTISEASDKIAAFNNRGKAHDKNAIFNGKSAIEIFDEAEQCGRASADHTIPTPMVVNEHKNMADDSSPVIQSWYVTEGVCGFAWVDFKCKDTITRKFINQMKKLGDKNPLRNNEGWTYWVSYGGQSLQRKEDFALAFSRKLHEYGINCRAQSRID